MKVTIEAPFSLRDDDREVINDKILSLKDYGSRFTGAEVYFKKDDGGEKPDLVKAEIVLRVPGKDLFTKHYHENAMTAFNQSFQAIKRQVKDRRSKRNDHRSDVKEINNIVNDNF